LIGIGLVEEEKGYIEEDLSNGVLVRSNRTGEAFLLFDGGTYSVLVVWGSEKINQIRRNSKKVKVQPNLLLLF
jgi:hypothetical protein